MQDMLTTRAVNGSTHKQRNLWELAILVLGLNLWVTFLLVPLLHLSSPSGGTTWLCVPPLVALGAGVALRNRLVLLAIYPLLLAVPTLVTPKLVGVNVYSPLTFCMVAVSFVAYMIATVALLEVIHAPAAPTESKSLGQVRLDQRWRRRVRIHRWFAVLAAVFPAVLIFTAFLHPGVQQDLTTYFPRRGTSPQVFAGVLVLLLWLAVFYAYFLLPLKAHARGDPYLSYELRKIRHDARTGKPRGGFYFFVAMALIFMVLLVVGRGCS